MFYRFFIGTTGWTKQHQWRQLLNISSIIIQSTCTNLENLIRPLTILDNILSKNVTKTNIIPDNTKDVMLLEDLFCSVICGKQYKGNQYVWNTFKAFVNHKERLDICIDLLVKYCQNNGLLKLLVTDIVKAEEGEKYLESKYVNKNLLRRQILSIFNKVTHLFIYGKNYPISLESLLSLIDGTQIKRVSMSGCEWLREPTLPSFIHISRKYRKAGFEIIFNGDDTRIKIHWTGVTHRKQQPKLSLDNID